MLIVVEVPAALEAATMEEEVLEGAAVPNQEEEVSNLPAVEAFPVEEEASFPGVEELHHDHDS